jgi:hypothetical protein
MPSNGKSLPRPQKVFVGSRHKFDTLPTIGGYEVIATDTGRPVATRETLHSAMGVAQSLNQAAASGRQALARALGATE